MGRRHFALGIQGVLGMLCQLGGWTWGREFLTSISSAIFLLTAALMILTQFHSFHFEAELMAPQEVNRFYAPDLFQSIACCQ